jgi:cell division protein FtsZ
MEEGGIYGARGVLINITASSSLSIHDVNEACNLIRAATQNDDVQINFGVVMDESMGDAVKITVIGTGFQRDSLPEIRSSSFPSMFENTSNGNVSHEPQQDEAVNASGEDQGQAPPPDEQNDLETPAYLRKKRQMVQ